MHMTRSKKGEQSDTKLKNAPTLIMSGAREKLASSIDVYRGVIRDGPRKGLLGCTVRFESVSWLQDCLKSYGWGDENSYKTKKSHQASREVIGARRNS